MRRINLFLFLFCTLIYSCTTYDRQPGKTVFRYNEAANITSLDPAFAKDQTIIWAANQIFNGLVQLNDRMEILPCIATSWNISESGLDYIFHLRNDVCFHDSPSFPGGKGRRVLARDFVFSFQRIIDPGVASPGAWLFNNVDNSTENAAFEAVNDSTFVIHLGQPFPPFLRLLSMQYCSVIPKEAVAFYGSEFRRNPVGTGPFRFSMWEEGVKLILLKNPVYFETEHGIRLPFLDAVAISFVPDKQSVFLEFIKGNLDLMSGIDPTYKDELLTKEGRLQSKYFSTVDLITQPYLNTEYLGFMVDPANRNIQGYFPVKEIRKAINLAFDRKKMIRYLRNNIGVPGCQGITPKGLPSFDSTQIFYDYDPEKARLLLAEAGYPNGAGLPVITLTSTSDYLDICKYIQHQVSTFGIELKIEVSPPAAVKEMKAEAKLPFFRASWIADYPDAENYLSMFYSRNFCPKGPNYTHFSNPEFDRLYEESMLTVNDSIRFSYYRKMEQIMMEEAPVVILYYDQVLRFVQKNIHGLGSNPMNLLTLKRVKKSG
ncbi:MAG: ABC transporter substrate-binding protein [Bacteroidales bacterium]|nr:ABC transporter substrate-binding protein [Bacteroidales bacterium]